MDQDARLKNLCTQFLKVNTNFGNDWSTCALKCFRTVTKWLRRMATHKNMRSHCSDIQGERSTTLSRIWKAPDQSYYDRRLLCRSSVPQTHNTLVHQINSSSSSCTFQIILHWPSSCYSKQ